MIVVDTSVIACLFLEEEEAQRFAGALEKASAVAFSAASYLEMSIVLRARLALPDLTQRIDQLISDGGIRIDPVTVEQARIARDAHARFGKGSGHPAQLNFGDCFSYALARALDAPLLFKGNDFSHTDIRPALTS
jgi:ribonuclease VapC